MVEIQQLNKPLFVKKNKHCFELLNDDFLSTTKENDKIRY